jgi:hypothetical protein
VLGDMRDLSVFPDASFDVVVNPVPDVSCPDLAPAWRESFRVGLRWRLSRVRAE